MCLWCVSEGGTVDFGDSGDSGDVNYMRCLLEALRGPTNAREGMWRGSLRNKYAEEYQLREPSGTANSMRSGRGVQGSVDDPGLVSSWRFVVLALPSSRPVTLPLSPEESAAPASREPLHFIVTTVTVVTPPIHPQSG
jgi:hypothetical protein